MTSAFPLVLFFSESQATWAKVCGTLWPISSLAGRGRENRNLVSHREHLSGSGHEQGEGKESQTKQARRQLFPSCQDSRDRAGWTGWKGALASRGGEALRHCLPSVTCCQHRGERSGGKAPHVPLSLTSFNRVTSRGGLSSSFRQKQNWRNLHFFFPSEVSAMGCTAGYFSGPRDLAGVLSSWEPLPLVPRLEGDKQVLVNCFLTSYLSLKTCHISNMTDGVSSAWDFRVQEKEQRSSGNEDVCVNNPLHLPRKAQGFC